HGRDPWLCAPPSLKVRPYREETFRVLVITCPLDTFRRGTGAWLCPSRTRGYWSKNRTYIGSVLREFLKKAAACSSPVDLVSIFVSRRTTDKRRDACKRRGRHVEGGGVVASW